ncbi:MAG TPA: class I tRNA ligase family protein, partial [Paracoccaceae bacterium]|nr:class I tRNA ligase family protein [Paracoccaceae bacterium]
QRAWGVPLACFMRGSGEEVELLRNEEVNRRIVDAFREEGADAWFKPGAKERFLSGIEGIDAKDWQQVTDILDVWFDSGSTHAFALRDRPGAKWPASLYLEGTDQHRGWFHSSLLQSCGTRGRAPYEGVLTHGFVLDERGQKMSKSLGNTTAPQDVTRQYGADILRLWVAQSDYAGDLRIGPEILKGAADSYRRLRNSFRYMLGALGQATPPEMPLDEMPELERWVLHRLVELDAEVRASYRAYDFQDVYQRLFQFCTNDLSAHWFDIRKDALYCDAPESPRRRACLWVMARVFERLTTWLAPILPFTMEEVWLNRHPGEEESVHLHDFPETPEEWRDDDLAARWVSIWRTRRVVTGALEIERRAGRIGASLEAAPILHVEDGETRAALASIDLADLCITSAIELTSDAAPESAFRLEDVPGVAVVPAPAPGEKCQRCWRILPEVGQQRDPNLCARCESAVQG